MKDNDYKIIKEGIELFVEKTNLVENKLKSKNINHSIYKDVQFIKAVVSKVISDSEIIDVVIEKNIVLSIPKALTSIIYNDENINVNDMVSINSVNKVDLLNNLYNRYLNKQIYTLVGMTLLVVNPFEELGLYNEKIMNNFIMLNRSKLYLSSKEGTSPHIYLTMLQIIDNINSTRKPQALIISGESGAGKTETAKQAMKMLTYTYEFQSQKNTNEYLNIANFSEFANKLNFYDNKNNISNKLSDDIKGNNYYISTKNNLDIFTNNLRKKRASIQTIKRESLKRKTLINDINKLQYKQLDLVVPIEDKILSCNPILEAFGNCKTVRNDNSSRFGKYVKLYIDVKRKEIAGAYIETYLLEKSRVSHLNSGERHYHIMYQLISAATKWHSCNYNYTTILESKYPLKSTDKYIRSQMENIFKAIDFKKLCLCNSSDTLHNLKLFKYLNSDVFIVSNLRNLDYDENEFYLTLESFIKTGFELHHIIGIIELLAVILHIGNINIIISKENSDYCVILHETILNNFENYNPLNVVSNILDINKELLEESLTFHCRIIQNKKILSNLNVREGVTNRDSLAKELYQRIFNSIVSHLNNLLLSNEMKDRINSLDENISYVGILDIFGFESFNENYFEQLCINYANEKLQQLYITDVFKENERLFKQEGLEKEFKEMSFKDNQSIIDVFDKHPTGLYYLLDNECNIKGSDVNLLEKIVNTDNKKQYTSNSNNAKSGIKYNSIIKKSFKHGRFIVNHSVKEVEYNIEDFIEKNLDDIRPLIKEILNSIKIKQFVNILKFETPAWPKYLGGKFRTNLNNLTNELKNSNCQYVRCIKPNEMKIKENFDQSFVYNQIMYLGILDSIRIRQEGYSVRLGFKEFYEKFSDVLKNKEYDINKLIKNEIFNINNSINKTSTKKSIIDINNIDQIFYKNSNNINNINSKKKLLKTSTNIDSIKFTLKEYCLNITNTLDNMCSKENILFGKTLIFIKQNYYNFMLKKKEEIISPKLIACDTILAYYKGYKIKSNYLKMKKIVPILQKNFRTKKEKRNFIKLKIKTQKIQALVRKKILGKLNEIKFKKELKKLKEIIGKFKIILRKKLFFKKIQIIKNFIIYIKSKYYLRKTKFMRQIILNIIDNSIFNYLKRMYNIKVIKIQAFFRLNKFKKDNKKLLNQVKNCIFTAKTKHFSKVIQRNIRCYLIKNKLKKLKNSAIFIQKIYNRFKVLSYLKKLKISTNIIKRNWLNQYYKNKIFYDYMKKYIAINYNNIEATTKLLNNDLFNKQMSFNIFTKNNNYINYNNNIENNIPTSVSNKSNCNVFDVVTTNNNLSDIDNENKYKKYFEKQSILANPRLQTNNPKLKSFTFENPKLHFMAYIMDIEIYGNFNENFSSDWAKHLKNLISLNINNNNPILNIEIGAFHTMCINNSGNLYVWGNNSNGQLFTEIEEAINNKIFKINIFGDTITNKLKGNNSINRKFLNENHAISNNNNHNNKNLIINELEDVGEYKGTYELLKVPSLNKEKCIKNLYNLNNCKIQNYSIPTSNINNNTTLISPNNDLKNLNEYSYKDNTNNINLLYNKNVYKLKRFNSFNITNPILIENPFLAINNTKIRQICSGEDFSIAVTKDYQVLVSGNNNNFQLGVKDSNNIYYPFNLTDYLKTTYPDLKNIKIKEAKICNNYNVYLVSTTGILYQLSNYRNNTQVFSSLVSYDIKLIYSIKVYTIECGSNFSIILSISGVVFSLGDNKYGQLGVGDFNNRLSPCEVIVLKNYGIKTSQIACGFKHVVIKTSIGKVYSWGHVSNKFILKT